MKDCTLNDLLQTQPAGKIRMSPARQITRVFRAKSKMMLLIILCLVSGAFHVSAQEIVPSRIKSVTVFTNQALVTREANIKLHKGLNEILIDIEAYKVDIDSVSARVFAKGELYSVQFRDIYLEVSPQKNIRALEEELGELRSTRVALEDSRTLLQNKERFLLSVIDFSEMQLPQDIKTTFPKIQDLENTLTFLGKSFKKINEERRALNSKIDLLKKKIQTAEKKLASLTIYRKKEKKAVEVQFYAEAEQVIKVETSYLVQDAYWKPVYKVDAATDLKTVNLTMFSRIHQKTGEDWKNIKLTVSNAIPIKGARLPEIKTWNLDIARPQPIAAVSKHASYSRNERDQLDALEVKEPETGTEEAEFAGSLKKEMPFSFEYQMSQNLDIESKDGVTLLPVFTRLLTGEFLHLGVPGTSPFSFLIFKTTADSEILGGPMNVHFGSHFIGKVFLEEKRTGETFNINIGADRAVKIKRVKDKDKMKETYFGSFERNEIVREMAFTVAAENLKSDPVTMNILDSIPVSRTDKIKVESINIKPKPSEKNYQGREGVHMWSFLLKPKEVKKIHISFSVSYPKDEPVSGL